VCGGGGLYFSSLWLVCFCGWFFFFFFCVFVFFLVFFFFFVFFFWGVFGGLCVGVWFFFFFFFFLVVFFSTVFCNTNCGVDFLSSHWQKRVAVPTAGFSIDGTWRPSILALILSFPVVASCP